MGILGPTGGRSNNRVNSSAINNLRKTLLSKGINLPIKTLAAMLAGETDLADVLGNKVGAELHKKWQEERGFEPRVKVLALVDGKEKWFNEDQVPDGAEILFSQDIANTKFDDLHDNWKKENMEAGIAASQILIDTLGSDTVINKSLELDSSTLEAMAEKIHDEWMARNPKEDWNAHLHIPYSELSEEEKEKDRVHILAALEALKKYKQ